MPALRSRGAEVLAISPEPRDRLARYARETSPGFVLLSDPGSQTARRWGIASSDHRGLPHPTAVVIDAHGVVRYLRVDEDYRVRPPVSELLDALDSLAAGRTAPR